MIATLFVGDRIINHMSVADAERKIIETEPEFRILRNLKTHCLNLR